MKKYFFKSVKLARANNFIGELLTHILTFSNLKQNLSYNIRMAFKELKINLCVSLNLNAT